MKMKPFRIFLATLVTCLVSSGAFAQFSAGLELGLPLGDFGDLAKMGFGASVRYDKEIQDKLSWTATGGFLSYSNKDQGGTSISGSTTMIPIMGGVKYYFNESNNGLYAGADLGLVFASFSADIPGFGSYSTSETKFGFAPGVGYRVSSFDFSARFNLVSDLNSLGFRAAYVFGN